MADLRTRYMGFDLKNPIIVGASNLVTESANLKRMEKAGAAAIVYKSIFEEEVHLENLELYERKTDGSLGGSGLISLSSRSKVGVGRAASRTMQRSARSPAGSR